jgi:hypothetical protein
MQPGRNHQSHVRARHPVLVAAWWPRRALALLGLANRAGRSPRVLIRKVLLLTFASAFLIAASARAQTVPALSNSSWTASGSAEIYDPPKAAAVLTPDAMGAAGSVLYQNAISPSHLTVSFDETMACGENSCNGADGMALDILDASGLSAPPPVGQGGGELGFYPNKGIAVTLTQNSAPWGCYPADHFIGIADSEPPSGCPLHYLDTATGIPTLHNAENHVVIEVDWPSKTITVSIDGTQYISYTLPSGAALPGSAYVGFSAGTGNGAELHTIGGVSLAYSTTAPANPSPAPAPAPRPAPGPPQAPCSTASQPFRCPPLTRLYGHSKELYDGIFHRSPGSIGGIYARIYNYDPFVDPILGGESTAWAMLEGCSVSRQQNLTDCSAHRFAQIGWVKRPTGRTTLIEYIDEKARNKQEDCDRPKESPDLDCVSGAAKPAPIGTYSYYTVLWNNVPGKITLYVDGRRVASVPATFVPRLAIASDETHSPADQIAGDGHTPEVFSDLHIYEGGRWVPMHGTRIELPTSPTGSPPPWAGFRQATNDCFGTWDMDYGDASSAVGSACGVPTQHQSAQASSGVLHANLAATAVVLNCPVGTLSCAGKVYLQAGRGRARSSASMTHRRRLSVTRSYSAPPGSQTTIRLPLKRRERSVLRRRHRVRATLVLLNDRYGQNTKRVTLVSRHFHRRRAHHRRAGAR